MRTLTPLLLLAFAVGAAGPVQAQFYSTTDAYLNSINNNGQAAGSNGGQFVTWTAGGGVNFIGGIPDAGVATISDDGHFVSGMAMNGSTGKTEMALFDSVNHAWTTLGSLGSSSGSNASAAWGMTGDASVVVGNAWVDAGHAHAVYWKNGVVTDLGSSLSGHSSRAQAVSADGSLIGGYDEDSTGYWQGTVWKNGAETRLFNSSNDELGLVGAISGDGQWVYGEDDYTGNAYMWNANTGVQEFANPFGAQMTVTGVSHDGSVVVGTAGDFFSGIQGWIWTSATGVESMNTFASGLSGYGGQDLFTPLGVSADGSYITGYYANMFGFAAGSFVVHNPVPEPSSLALLAFGVPFLIKRRK